MNVKSRTDVFPYLVLVPEISSTIWVLRWFVHYPFPPLAPLVPPPPAAASAGDRPCRCTRFANLVHSLLGLSSERLEEVAPAPGDHDGEGKYHTRTDDQQCQDVRHREVAYHKYAGVHLPLLRAGRRPLPQGTERTDNQVPCWIHGR